MITSFIDDDGVISEVRAPFVRSPYNYDMNLAGDESGLKCEDSSLAVQSSVEECDINTIVRRFGLTGELPDTPTVPMSGDFMDVVDYQTALNSVIAADAAFMEYPAGVRSRFDNDPQKMMEFVADVANLDEARRLGLLKPLQVEPAPLSVRVIADTPVAGVGTVST